VTEQDWGPRQGGVGKDPPSSEGSGWGLEVRMPGSPFPRCCLTSCAVLSVFFFSLLIGGRAGAGEQGKDLGKDCSRTWGQSWEPLSAMGLAQNPRESF
jgi:hypothetical protein